MSDEASSKQVNKVKVSTPTAGVKPAPSLQKTKVAKPVPARKLATPSIKTVFSTSPQQPADSSQIKEETAWEKIERLGDDIEKLPKEEQEALIKAAQADAAKELKETLIDVPKGCFFATYDAFICYVFPHLGLGWVKKKRYEMWGIHMLICILIIPLIGVAIGDIKGLRFAIIGSWIAGGILEIGSTFITEKD